MFAKMTRAEWEKPKAKTNDLRTDILKDAIANNNPIPDIDGKKHYCFKHQTEFKID